MGLARQPGYTTARGFPLGAGIIRTSQIALSWGRVMKHMLTLVALVGAAMFSACSGPAELSEPLSEPGSAPYDPRLVGMWLEVAGEGGVDVLIIRAHENGFLLADYVIAGAGGDDDEAGAGFLWVRRAAFATAIDGETYYNSRQVDTVAVSKVIGETPKLQSFDGDMRSWVQPHRDRGYWIFRPTIDEDDRMTLSYLAERDLEKHEYSGREIGCGDDCSFTLFDLSPEELAQLIRSADPDTLFTESFGTYTRITAESPSLR